MFPLYPQAHTCTLGLASGSDLYSRINPHPQQCMMPTWGAVSLEMLGISMCPPQSNWPEPTWKKIKLETKPTLGMLVITLV